MVVLYDCVMVLSVGKKPGMGIPRWEFPHWCICPSRKSSNMVVLPQVMLAKLVRICVDPRFRSLKGSWSLRMSGCHSVLRSSMGILHKTQTNRS